MCREVLLKHETLRDFRNGEARAVVWRPPLGKVPPPIRLVLYEQGRWKIRCCAGQIAKLRIDERPDGLRRRERRSIWPGGPSHPEFLGR